MSDAAPSNGVSAAHPDAVPINGAHAAARGYKVHPDYLDMKEGQYARPDGGNLQIGRWQPYEHRKLANPAPLGLSAFALTTFVLSLVNLHTRNVAVPNVVISLAFGYGGLVQLLAGMWEMACGNTFGATALSSYGGFWIAYAILLVPQFHALDPEKYTAAAEANVLGFFLTGWFIFTTLMVLCTLRSTVMFFSLFFTLDLAFLFLACENYATNMGKTSAADGLRTAGGVFGMLAAFLAWYMALVGIQDSSNSFFQLPVFHFPWSDHAQEQRKAEKTERQQV